MGISLFLAYAIFYIFPYLFQIEIFFVAIFIG